MATSISVVTPSFNQAAFVEETLRSVLDGGYPLLQYIVIDGGSTDGSVEVIKKYSQSIHYFVSEPDSGHCNALNKGFKHSTGDVMAWLNSDDKYLPWTLRTVAEIFSQHPDVNWIVGTNGWWNDKGALIRVENVYNNIHDYLSGRFFGIQQESVFWRRSLWERSGGYLDENYRFAFDAELWMRFFSLTPLWHVACVLSGYRLHRLNRAATHSDEYVGELSRILDSTRRKLDPRSVQLMEKDYLTLNYNPELGAWAKWSVPRRLG